MVQISLASLALTGLAGIAAAHPTNSYLEVQRQNDTKLSAQIIRTSDWGAPHGEDDFNGIIVGFPNWPIPKLMEGVMEHGGQLWLQQPDANNTAYYTSDEMYAWVPPDGGPIRLYHADENPDRCPSNEFEAADHKGSRVLKYQCDKDHFYTCDFHGIHLLHYYESLPKDHNSCEHTKVTISRRED